MIPRKCGVTPHLFRFSFAIYSLQGAKRFQKLSENETLQLIQRVGERDSRIEEHFFVTGYGHPSNPGAAIEDIKTQGHLDGCPRHLSTHIHKIYNNLKISEVTNNGHD